MVLPEDVVSHDTKQIKRTNKLNETVKWMKQIKWKIYPYVKVGPHEWIRSEPRAWKGLECSLCFTAIKFPGNNNNKKFIPNKCGIKENSDTSEIWLFSPTRGNCFLLRKFVVFRGSVCYFSLHFSHIWSTFDKSKD